MAIAVDATTTIPNNCCGGVTWSHTCTGSNLILIIAVYVDTNGGSSVSGITYNGVAMTQHGTTQANPGSGGGTIQCWYLLNPATGANTISMTRSGYALAVATSYSGVAGVQFDSMTATGGTSRPLTVSTTVGASNCWLITCFGANTNNSSVWGVTNRTNRAHSINAQPATPYLWCQLSDSNGTVSTGSQSFSLDTSDSSNSQYGWAALVFSLAPLVPTIPNQIVRSPRQVAVPRASSY